MASVALSRLRQSRQLLYPSAWDVKAGNYSLFLCQSVTGNGTFTSLRSRLVRKLQKTTKRFNFIADDFVFESSLGICDVSKVDTSNLYHGLRAFYDAEII